MASITLASQYFGNEGVPFILQPTVAGMAGETYQWRLDGTPIAGQTARALTLTAPTLAASGTYTVTAINNGISYSATTRVDIIQALPANYQRGVGEGASLSIQTIPGATYQWVRAEWIEQAPSNLSGKTGTTNVYTTVASTDYGVLQVRVSKNGVSALSNECYFTDYTPVTFDNGISQTFTFPNAERTYTFLETSPDGRFVFIDDASPRTLWVTVPGFADQTSFTKNIQLYELPKPVVKTSAVSTVSFLPQLRAYYGIFGQTPSSNANYYFMDEFRSYTDDGKYLAVVCNGQYAVRISGAIQSYNTNFVVVYKLEGTTITVVQTLFNCPYSAAYSGYIVNQATTISSTTPPVTVSFSGNGTYLGIMYGSSYADTGNSFRVYKKNIGDTWGTVVVSKTSGDSLSNVNHTFLVTPRTTGADTLLYAGRFNADGSFLSLCSLSASSIHTLGQPQNYFIYTINTSTDDVSRNTDLEAKLFAELQKITKATAYHRDDNITLPILFYFPRGDTTKLIGYNNVLSTSQVAYKNNIFLFSYSASTQTPSLVYDYNFAFFPGNNGSATANPSHTFFQISDDGAYLLNTWNQSTGAVNSSTKRIFKIPSYYHNKVNPVSGEISETNERAYTQYIHLFETSNIEVNRSYNGHIHGNKFILFNPDNTNYKMVVKTITPHMENVKPIVADTSPKIYIDQDECAVGSEITIRNLLSNTTFFGTSPKGILLRVKNNRDAVGNQVANWKLKSDYASNSTLINFSNKYTPINEDKWYIFYSDDNTSIRLDMDADRFFNNAVYPNNKITLEYKLWSGFGWNNPGFDSTIYTKNIAGPKNSYTINGSVVTIADISNSPFSNQTGQLQIFIKQIINTPDPFGYIYAPLTTTGTGAVFNNFTRNYVYSMNVLKNSLTSKSFSLRDIINIFRPTMSTNYPTNSTIPYSAENYMGGIGIFVKSQYSLQMSLDNGNTWYFLAASTNPANLTYFFSLRARNYLFRYARQGGSTTNLMNSLNVYIFPWNGVEISIGTDTFIKEFSSTNYTINTANEVTTTFPINYTINATNEIILTSPTKVSINEIQDADSPSFPDKGRYVTGDISRLLNTSGLLANIVNNTKPDFKSTSNRTYPLKMVDATGAVVNAYTNDTDTTTNAYSFSPSSIFYGSGGMGTQTIVLRPGLSANDTCDVYDPDISGDEQLLGLILPRDSSVFSINGKWQYTINSGSAWTDLYESPTSSNVIRFWSNRKYDTRIRLRFLPNLVKKTTSVSLPFYLYDGADFIPYAYDNNYESAAYQLNGTHFCTSVSNENSAMLTGRSDNMGALTLNIVHVNSAPVLNSSTYTPLVSSTYTYNSQKDISFNNIYPINKHIDTITYQTTYTNPQRTSFNTTSTYTTRKNALRINIADILNSSAIRDSVDSTDSIQLALYSGNFINASVKVYYTDGTTETLTNGVISKTNAILIPNYISGSPSTYSNFYNLLGQSFMNVNNVKGWIQPNGASYVSRLKLSGNQIINICDSINTASDYYALKNYVFDNGTPGAYPTLTPNAIHGLPVMRFERNTPSVLTPLFEQDGQNNQVLLRNTFIIVERPRAVDTNGFNALIGDSDNNFFFGYTTCNTITLTFNNRGTPKTISYSDSTIEIDPSKTHVPRVWTVFAGGSSDNVELHLNGKMVARLADTTKPSIFLDNATPRLGGYISWNGTTHHYEGDVCDLVSLTGLTLSQVKMFEDFLIHTWVNPQIYIEPLQNQTVNLSYDFYLWDGSNAKNLTSNYADVQMRGSNTPYSVNGSTFTIKVKKANSRPVLLMETSVAANSAIIPAISPPLLRSFNPDPIVKLCFRLGMMDMSIQNHDFTLTSIFDDIIKNAYVDEDIYTSSSHSKGLAITGVDDTLGIWSVVKTDGSVEILDNISVNNAYLIKRDTSGNRLRITLRASADPTANRFQTSMAAGLPGTSCFQAIAWDATDPSYSEYSKVDLSIAANPDDEENSFSIVEDGVFEFYASTRPYIAGKTSQTLFVYNSDEKNSTFTPMNLFSQFTTSQITAGTKRIDIYNIDNMDSNVVLQYMNGSTWTDIILPLSAPINGNYPIRVKESTAFRAINTTFSFLMALYDSGTDLYSPNFGSISVQVQEANLPPSIQTNPAAISKPRIVSITSSTITYEPVYNDIENTLGGELPPLFDFKIYTSFNSTSNIKPIIWADRNIGSNLKMNSFAIQVMETLNGRLYYADDNGEFKDVVVNKTSDRFLLSSANTLKYIPTSGNSGKAVLRVYAWDGVLGTVGTRTEVDASGTYTCGAFSNNYITIEFPVIPRNNAPSFMTDNKFYSAVVQQTDTNADISGISVKSIMTDTIGFDYVELNSVNAKGLAVVDASGGGLGVWQASTNGGALWTNISPGLHLLADENNANRIRYMFDMSRNTYPQSYSVIPTLRIMAWDNTNTAVNGDVRQIDASGGASAYSSETVRLGASIIHRNHAPILTAGPTVFNIGAVSANSIINIPFQTILSALGPGVMSDTDEGDVLGIKIVDVSFNNLPAPGIQMGTWSYTDSVLNGTYVVISANSPAELVSSRNPILRFQADKYVYGTTNLTFRAYDGELASANTGILALNINDINYAPTITNVADISYNVTFDVSRTILVSSIIGALAPTDPNLGTSYGIVLSAASFDANVALIQYSINPSASVPVYNTITNSLIGNGSTALHLPSNAAIRYTPKLNKSIQIALDVTLWDRSNNSTVVATAGYAVSVPSTRDELSPYSSSTIKLIFNHQQLNYAPTINAGTILLETVNGLATSSIYTISTILTQLAYASSNNGSGRGIAIIGTDICGGYYEYTIDSGSSWNAIPTDLGPLRALHLASARATNAIRYISTRNTTDYSTLTIIGWDQTNTVTNGAIATLPPIRGGNTSYSSNTTVLRVEQSHVNSRPTLTAGTVRSTTPVNYSTSDYTWFQFSDYVPISTTFHDVDYNLVKRDGVPQVADKTYGILITTADVSAGTWFISSDRKTITDITSVSADAACIVSPSDYFALRTSKNMDISFNITYKAWDKSSRTTATTVDTTDPTNTSYSVNSGSIIVPVKHVNTPPILNATATGFQAPTLYGDGDDNSNPTGVSVASIIDDLMERGVYADLDKTLWGYATEPAGIVVLGSSLNATAGTWTYSTNGGSSWMTLLLSSSTPLHLSYSSSNLIRFQPSVNVTGSATLRIAAWDQANGFANGSVQAVSSTERMGSLGQSYSVNQTNVVFPTAYLNHAPSFGTSTYTLPIVEYENVNDGKDWNSIIDGLSYTDKDTQDARGIRVDTITIPTGLTGTFQVLSDASWNTLTTGLEFTLPTYSSLRFVPAENITDDLLNASITIRPYDGFTIGNTSATVIVPVKRVLFFPTFTVTLPTNLIQSFRADNKLSSFGGLTQGVSMTKFLDDMGFSSQSTGEARGIAIQTLRTNGITGYYEVKLGNASWARIPTIPMNNFYHVAEFTGSVMNRIRFFSTNSANTGFVSTVFYGWNQTDNSSSGTLKRYTSRPTSFSEHNGIYRMNIQSIVGK